MVVAFEHQPNNVVVVVVNHEKVQQIADTEGVWNDNLETEIDDKN